MLHPWGARNSWDPVDHGWEQLAGAWAWIRYLLPIPVALTTEPVSYHVRAEVGPNPYIQSLKPRHGASQHLKVLESFEACSVSVIGSSWRIQEFGLFMFNNVVADVY